MADEFEQPATSHLKLKPKEIVRTDPVARPDDPDAISVQSIHRQNRAAEEARKQGQPLASPAPEATPAGFKLADITPVTPLARPGDPEAIAVPKILRANLEAQRATGYAELAPMPRRKSRRTRDFFLIVGTIDLALAAVMLVERTNVAVLVFALGGVVLLSSTFAWIMFFVMDDY